MASSFTSYAFTPSTTYPGSTITITITQDELNLFHKIDRTLFTRLVFNLGRNSSQAIQVMALFLWFERTSKNFRLVSKLLNWPDSSLRALVDEVVMALDCIESDQFSSTDNNNNVPMMQILTNSGITLDFFHENRLGIIRAIAKITNDVCIKAFTDILQHEKSMKELNSLGIVVVNDDELVLNPGNYHKLVSIPTSKMQQVMYYNPSFGAFVPQRMGAPQLLGTQMTEGSSNVDFGRHNLQYQKDFLNNEINEILSKSALDDGISATGTSAGERREVSMVPPDDRTIFMTFSRGYPISNAEVQDFFTRTYGDIVEGIYVQEVQTPLQQPLYARLVVRSADELKVVLGYTGRAKFTINGKHAWARKYIRKSIRSPPKSPTTSGRASPYK